jgi:hypothetical protein
VTDSMKLTKTIVKFIAGRSVGSVITKVIRNNVAPASRVEEIQLVIGAHILGELVADRAIDWAENEIDELVESYTKLRARFAKKPE